ncbi:MAG: DUF2336 domain-containing protein [Pseudomonadota bacterium]
MSNATSFSSSMEHLLSLAQDRSIEARKQLSETIVDFFLEPDFRLNEQERSLMSEILIKLIGGIESDVKARLANNLTLSGISLPELEKQLAADEIDVAAPILKRSKVLRDPDLIEIIHRRSHEHRVAIAQRQSINEELGDALVKYGDEDVIETLLRNEDADLSSSAMQYLVAESRRVGRYQEPLLNRDDLPAELAYRMYWWVSAALRAHILDSYDVDEITLDTGMERATKEALSEYEESHSAVGRAIKLVRRLKDQRELNVSFLVRSLRQQRINIFVAGIAVWANISFKIAWRIISDRGFESLTILGRAIDIERSDMATIILLLADAQNPTAARRPDVLNKIMDMFDNVDARKAQRILSFWQRDLDYEAAIYEVEKAANG